MAGNTPLGRMLIDIDLDTTKLGSSTSHLQRQMRIVNSAMRANLASLKDNGKESDVLSTKIDGLNKKQKIQAGIVEQTEKRYQELVKTKGAGAKETEAYANTLNREQAKLREVTNELKEMERQQKVMNSNWTKLGNSLTSAGNGLNTFGNGMKQVGGGLTRYITAPVLGAITAAGGLTAAFGWKRLVGIDNARAQLKGMGYDAKQVEEISGEVSKAIDGGMMTMAEGTSVAAGALAAGVEQGAELEKYIKLVDAAAVGANRPVADMAMIFNRVQGSGKLMTEELNMIEDGMPGFSKAMSDHMGVSMEEFRKMVTEGQVTSDDFLTVMDDFAGGMADAYAGTWSGMLANTKANIGKLGENLLSGVFEQSKDSISEFLDLLRSDAVKTWSIAAGETIGQVFTNIVDKVRTGVQWFTNLSTEGKKMAGIITGVAVAAGPLLTALGTGAIFIGKVATALAPLATKIGEAGGLFKFLGGTIASLSNPITITIGIIALLATGFTIAYNKSETFRNGIHNIIGKVKETWDYLKQFGTGVKELFTGSEGNGKKILSALGVTDDNITRITGLRDNIMSVKDKAVELGNTVVAQVKPALDSVMSFIGEVGTKLSSMWSENSATIIPVVTNIGNIISTVFSGILSVINFIMPAVFAVIKMVWGNIQGVIRGGLKVIDGLVKVFSGIFTGDFSKMWEGVKNIFSGAIQLVWNGFQLLFYGRIIKGVGSLVSLFTGSIRGLWTRVVDLFSRLFQSSTQIISNMNTAINKTISNLVKSVFNFFRNMLTNTTSTVNSLGRNVWNLFQTMRIRVVETVKTLFNSVKSFFTNMFNNVRTITTRLKDTVIRLFRLVLTIVSSVVRTLFNTIRSIFTNIFNTVRNIVTRLKNTAVNLFNSLRNSVTGTIRNLYNSVRNFFSNMFSSVRNTVGNMRTNVVNLFGRMRDGAVNGVTRMKDRVKTLFNNVKDDAKKAFDNMVKGAKELPSKLGNAIKNGKQKAVDGIKSMGNSMINQLEKVVNGLIKGLNNVTGKLGITATVKEWSAPKFSTGTGATSSLVRNGAIAKDTLATVGDRGIGNGRGTRELVQYPNGTTGLYDNDATIFAPKGTIIWNNKQTEDILAQSSMPKFSTGSGAKNQNTKKKKGLLGTMKDVLSNTWDYIKNPKKAFDAIVSSVSAKFDGLKGFAATAAKGGFNFIKDKAFEWIKGIFKDNEGGLGNGKAASFMKYAMTTPYSPNKAVPGYPTSFNGGRHYGIDYGTPVGTPVHATLGGKVSKLYNNGGGLVAKLQSGDITQFFMHLSDIIKTGSVKAGDLIAKTGNSGQWTTGAHIHWQAQKGSQVMNSNTIDPRKVLKSGFATGGLVNRGLYALGEEGHPEWIIPTDPKRRTDAMKLLAYAGKSLQKNNGNLRPNNLPNIPSDGNNSNDLAELKEMVANQQEMISLLAKIAEKDYVALYNEKHLARDIEPEVSKRQEFKNGRDTRLA